MDAVRVATAKTQELDGDIRMAWRFGDDDIRGVLPTYLHDWRSRHWAALIASTDRQRCDERV